MEIYKDRYMNGTSHMDPKLTIVIINHYYVTEYDLN